MIFRQVLTGYDLRIGSVVLFEHTAAPPSRPARRYCQEVTKNKNCNFLMVHELQSSFPNLEILKRFCHNEAPLQNVKRVSKRACALAKCLNAETEIAFRECQNFERRTVIADKLIPVYKTSDLGRAEVIRLALEENGIRCALENELQAGFSGVLQCRLFVLDRDEHAARRFIEAHEKHGEAASH